MAKVAVIGAGVGGLCAALDLATRGVAVTVFEGADAVGGKLGFVDVDGVEADTGPSLLTMPDVFDDLFRRANTSLRDEVELLTHDVAYDCRWPDGAELTIYQSPAATLESVEHNFGAKSAKQFASFLAYAEKIWSAAAPAFVLGDAPKLINSWRQLGALRQIDPLRTMRGAIESHVKQPHLRDVLSRFATYNGSDPRRAPATLNCIAHVELTLGGHGVRGGMYTLARALRRVSERHGVVFELGRQIGHIRRTNGKVQSVVTVDGDAFDFDAVVANGDAAHVFGDLLETTAPGVTPSMSGWTALVRTARSERPPHGVLFPERYLAEFEDIFDHHRLPTDPTVYVCSQEKAHERVGFDDEELLFVMANAPADPAVDCAQLRETVLAKLANSRWTSAAASVVWERTPAGLANRFPGSNGAIYGGSSNSKFAAFARPPNRVAEVKGLYLAGGSAHPGGGLPLCALSGRAAARALAEDFDI